MFKFDGGKDDAAEPAKRGGPEMSRTGPETGETESRSTVAS